MTPTQIREVIKLLENEGWKVVPKEPESAMIESGSDEAIAPIPTAGMKAEAIYRTMISAAPPYEPKVKP